MHRHGLRCVQEVSSRASTSTWITAGAEDAVTRRYVSSVARQRKPSPRVPHALLEEGEHLAKKLVGTSQNDRKRKWKSPSHGIDGVVPHLAASVRTKQKPAKPFTEDQTKFYTPDPADIVAEDELAAADLGLRTKLLRGSFVEVRRNEVCEHGVVLFTFSEGGRTFPCSLTSSGEVWRHQEGDVMFVIPHFIDQTLADRCGAQNEAENEHQIAARVKVLQRLRAHERALEQEMNTMSTSLFSLYDKVAAKSPSSWARITESQAVELLDLRSTPNPAMARLAVHKHMFKKSECFLADALNFTQTQSFLVRPRSHVADMSLVQQMVFRRDTALDDFIAKAQKRVEASRQITQSSRTKPPSVQLDDQTDLSSTDEAIVRFLRYSLRKRRSVQQDPFTNSLSYIMKNLKLYPGEIDSHMLHQFLADLGYVPPWQDVISRNVFTDMRGDPPKLDTPSTPSLIVQPKPTKFLGPNELYDHDIVQSLRHDFGRLPVYVIDDVGAEELDDGLSIEAVPSHPEQTWVHVHIADPTSILPPTHTWSLNAFNQLETHYWVDRTDPMLPSEEVLQKLSLGDSVGGTHQPTLTFSLKVNNEGDILNYTVRPGLVCNVIKLKYDQVDAALGNHAPFLQRPFGGQARSPIEDLNAITPQMRDDLTALRGIASRLWQARARNGAVGFYRTRVLMSLQPKPPPTTDSEGPSIFRGFPEITYNVEDSTSLHAGARGMVSEMMISASRIASIFFRDRGIPTIRRATQAFRSTLEHPNAQEEFMAARDEFGIIPLATALRHRAVTSASETTLEPKAHGIMGIPDGEGYVRATSPLRRFGDMVVHWQIKHALLHPDRPVLFSDEWLLTLARWMDSSGSVSRRLNFAQHHFFALHFIERWRALPPDAPEKQGRPDPLRDLTAIAIRSVDIDPMRGWPQVSVHIPALGLKSLVIDLPPDQYFEEGQELPVNIESMKMGVDPFLTLRLRESA